MHVIVLLYIFNVGLRTEWYFKDLKPESRPFSFELILRASEQCLLIYRASQCIVIVLPKH